MDVRPATGTTTRLLTIPNILSFLRLLGVPLFLYLVLVTKQDGWALVVLGLSGVSDYLDGKIARRFGQESPLGRILDPVADRLYIIAVVIGLALRHIVPLWLVVILLARDAVLALTLPSLKKRGYNGLPVHFLGKAATFNLLYAFPLLLLGDGTGAIAELAKVFGWAFAVWGTALYWWAGVLYLLQVRRIVSAPARSRA